MPPRAFISFQMEDRYARNFLVQQAKDKRNDIEFVDYSVQDPFDSSWKTQCRDRIARTKGTIVLVGDTTHRSDAVIWEIEETYRQSHFLFGIWIHDSSPRPSLPPGLTSNRMIPWNFERIVSELESWA